jgi:hypothetical protein
VHRKRVLEKYLADMGTVMPGARVVSDGDSLEPSAPAEDLTGTLGGSTTH